MTKYVFSLCLILLFGLIAACGSTQNQRPSKLPDFQECIGEPEVFDVGVEFNELKDLNGISYAYTYNLIHSQSDSLEIEGIRKFNSELAKSVVKHIFPRMYFLSDSILRVKNYNDIMFNTSDLKWSHRKPESVQNLLVKTEKEKQLFIEVRTYTHKPQFETNINIFVFDTKLNTLLYFDKVQYHCDIRDKNAYIKILSYALNKLKQFPAN
ncbi:hypothetical protein [Flagellimonas sp.]|uniref:hypothetical protein n=1 Tax=Flagellimonas sp. TaxID=2058762 RepID=UPI003B5038BC